MTMRRLICGLVIVAAPATGSQQAPDITAAIRPLVESTLREQAGIGFAEFSCDVEPPLVSGQRFRCRALDEQGDRLRYTLEVDDAGIATIVAAAQEVVSLQEEFLEPLSEPCVAFLVAFDQGQWDRLLEGLHPALREEMDADQMRSRLPAVRTVLGELAGSPPSWYSVSESGQPELEYPLGAEVEGAVARFRLAEDDDAWKIIAFIITGEAGTPANVALAREQAVAALTPILGSEVTDIEAPLERLSAPGDLVEGTVVLADGRKLPIAAQQTGPLDDLDPSDYFFSVLDAEIVVTAGVRDRLEGVTSVECDAPVVPDGGEIQCLVHRDGAPPLPLLLSRRGVEHRIRSVENDG